MLSDQDHIALDADDLEGARKALFRPWPGEAERGAARGGTKV